MEEAEVAVAEVEDGHEELEVAAERHSRRVQVAGVAAEPRRVWEVAEAMAFLRFRCVPGGARNTRGDDRRHYYRSLVNHVHVNPRSPQHKAGRLSPFFCTTASGLILPTRHWVPLKCMQQKLRSSIEVIGMRRATGAQQQANKNERVCNLCSRQPKPELSKPRSAPKLRPRQRPSAPRPTRWLPLPPRARGCQTATCERALKGNAGSRSTQHRT